MNQKTLERLEYLRHAGEPGEPDASKGCKSGSVGRGWYSWETKTWPLTRHHALNLTLGNHYLAPLPPTVRMILDVGTGTGIWAAELAEVLEWETAVFKEGRVLLHA